MKFLFSLSLLVLINIACAQETKDVPDVVKTKLSKLYPETEKVEWKNEDGNIEAEFEINDVKTTVLFDQNGNLLETETEIAESDLPVIVKETLAKDFADYEMDEPVKIDRQGEILYEVELEKGEVEFDAVFSADGKLVEKQEMESDEDEGKENEEESEDGDDEEDD